MRLRMVTRFSAVYSLDDALYQRILIKKLNYDPLRDLTPVAGAVLSAVYGHGKRILLPVS